LAEDKVPELTRGADIKLNKRLTLRRQLHALSSAHRILPPSGRTPGKAGRRSYSAWRLCLSADHAQRPHSSLLDDCKLFSCDYARYDRLALAHRLDRASTLALLAV